jgi:hypothetical protein
LNTVDAGEQFESQFSLQQGLGNGTESVDDESGAEDDDHRGQCRRAEEVSEWSGKKARNSCRRGPEAE